METVEHAPAEVAGNEDLQEIVTALNEIEITGLEIGGLNPLNEIDCCGCNGCLGCYFCFFCFFCWSCS